MVAETRVLVLTRDASRSDFGIKVDIARLDVQSRERNLRSAALLFPGFAFTTMEQDMFRKTLASTIAIGAVIGLVASPAIAAHKHKQVKHGQTTGMSTSTKTSPGVAGGGAGPSGSGATGGVSSGAGGATK
jgi:uncharacterized membrane protein YgcG